MKYEISKGTLAIVPNEEKSMVYEDGERYIIDETPFNIMEESCLYFGSSYEGKKELKRYLVLNIKYQLLLKIQII